MTNSLIDKCEVGSSDEEIRFFSSCKYISPWSSASKNDQYIENQVVTCFLWRGDKFLVLQRGKKDAQYRLWGIPGGKLHSTESLLGGLCREILEETGATLCEAGFAYLGSMGSKTLTDGCYGLHLYQAEFANNTSLPVINQSEHLAYQWVSLDEFIHLNLLHAQREAFQYVYPCLLERVKKTNNKMNI